MARDVYWKARLIFAAVLCAGGLAGLAWYAWTSVHSRTYLVETQDPVSGLIPDAPVEFHGVEVGKVTKVKLVGPTTVRILLSVAKDAPISKATVATITARGLAARGFAGYVYVALENTGVDPSPLSAAPGRSYPVITAAPSRIATMDTVAFEAVERVETLTRLALSVLDPKTIDSLKRSIDGLQAVTTTLAANNQRLTSLIANAERDSRDVRPLIEASNSTIRELHTQVLPQFYRAIGDLDGLTRTMSGIADRLSRNPAALLRGTAVPPGPGER